MIATTRCAALRSLLAILAGCTTPVASERATLISVATEAAPEGSDAPPRHRVAFQLADGSLAPVDRVAVAFVPRWRNGAALVDPARRLYAIEPLGPPRMLARDATGALAVSADGALLAYVVAGAEVRIHDGAREHTIASEIASAGALQLSGQYAAFVGARSGGIAGVWIAPLDGSGARCLTNCDLRTGTDWQAAFVRLPADRFELSGRSVAWIDDAGARHEISLGEVQ